jgi:hypothetical protein
MLRYQAGVVWPGCVCHDPSMAAKDDATWYRMMASTMKFFIRVDLLVAGTLAIIAFTADPRSGAWIPPALFAGIAIYFLVGYFLGGIRAGPSGVTVGKLAGRRIRVPWADVERFDIVPVRGRGTTYYVGVVRKGAKPALTGACCYEEAVARTRTAKIKEQAAHVVDELEAIRLRQPGQSTSQSRP